MKLRKPALLALSSLLLAGCAGASTSVPESSEKLMTIGSKTITKGDEYQLLKRYAGPQMVLTDVNRMIFDKEVGVTDEIKKEAEDTVAMYDTGDTFEEQLKQAGYESKQAYIDDAIIPGLQQQELTKKYFQEAKEEIETEFRPVLAIIIQTDSEDNANKALEALKNGDDAGKVGAQYAPEDSTYTGSEQIVTTQDTALPTELLNALLDAGKEGVLGKVYTNDTSTDEVDYYVASVVSTNYDKNLDKIVAALSSNQTIATDCQVYYLKKYGFEVHDQYIFDYYKANNPQYLVTRPDLAETSQTSAQ